MTPSIWCKKIQKNFLFYYIYFCKWNPKWNLKKVIEFIHFANISYIFFKFSQLSMIQQDRKEKERSEAKNSVEEYIYEIRDKLANEYEKFIYEEVNNYCTI